MVGSLSAMRQLGCWIGKPLTLSIVVWVGYAGVEVVVCGVSRDGVGNSDTVRQILEVQYQNSTLCTLFPAISRFFEKRSFLIAKHHPLGRPYDWPVD